MSTERRLMNQALIRGGWLSFIVLMLGAQIAAAADFSGWAKHTTLTFSGYSKSETLTDFPVLVVLSTDILGFNYSDFQSPDHDDLRFTDDTQTTELSYEVESWNPVGKSYVWVKVPTLTNNAVIHAFWGLAGQTAPAYTANGATWNSNYRGVWHMQNVNAADSTANGYSGTAAAGVSQVSGLIGSANSFDGTNGSITVATPDLYNGSEDLTIEFWANAAATQLGPHYPNIIDYGHAMTPSQNFVLQGSDPSGLDFGWYVRGANGTWVTGGTVTLIGGQWMHVTLTKAGTTYKSYINGIETGSGEFYGLIEKNITKNLRFGNNVDNPDRLFTGALDEMRVSNTGRSSNWVWATWFNTASNSDFVTIAAVEASSGAPSISTTAATGVGTASATLNGDLTSTGTAATTVFVYWGTTDQGTNANLWAHTNVFAGAAVPGAYSTNVSLSPSGVIYYYRYCATNSQGIAWAPTSEHFLAGSVTVANTDGSAVWDPVTPETGTLTISRDASATNESLTVNYAWGGTAVLNSDYAPSPSGTNVTLPAGVASTNITITPLFGPNISVGATVWLSLLPGEYAVGTPASNDVAIASYTYVPGVNQANANGNWNDATIWSLHRWPMAGDDVTINANVTMTNSSDHLSSYILNNGFTNTFHGTNTALIADNVTIHGVMTHDANTATVAPWTPDNRIRIQCTNLSIAADGAINVAGKGYLGGVASANGNGPGGGTAGNEGAGGGYGGSGGYGGNTGWHPPGAAYGSIMLPTDPGSGGGSCNPDPRLGSSGNGGGAVWLEVAATATVDGMILADGAGSWGLGGGGAGGSVYLKATTLLGNGSITAKGCGTSWSFSSGGGGGRISLDVGDATGWVGQIDVAAGLADPLTGYRVLAQVGTVYVTSASLLPETFTNQHWRLYGAVPWALSQLTVSNATLAFEDDRVNLAVAGNLTVVGSDDSLVIGTPNMTSTGTVTVGGNMTLSNNASLYVYSGPTTNGVAPDCGFLVSVGGDLLLASGSWVYPYSNPTNGVSVKFQVNNLTIMTNAGFNANGTGYGGYSGIGFGPGYSGMGNISIPAGASYGGLGGQTDSEWGVAPTNGSVEMPTGPGSGAAGYPGGGFPGCAGGGLVRIEASNRMTINGTITANGMTPLYWVNYGGGGSGGAIYLRCVKLAGDTAILSANGGDALGVPGSYSGGAGGGGRIAVWTGTMRASTNTWSVTVNGGAGVSGYAFTDGGVGTIYWGAGKKDTGTIISVR